MEAPSKPLIILLAAVTLTSPVAIAGTASNPDVTDDTEEPDPRTDGETAIPDSVDITNAWITPNDNTLSFTIQVQSLFIPHTTATGMIYPAQYDDVRYEVRVDVSSDVFTGAECGDATQLYVSFQPTGGLLWPAHLNEGSVGCIMDSGDFLRIEGALVSVDRSDATITVDVPRQGSHDHNDDAYALDAGTTLSNPTVLTYAPGGYEFAPVIGDHVDYDHASSDAEITI